MQLPYTTKTKVLITGMVTLFIFSMLLWEHFHGGVASHHLLAQDNLPAVSNWWGGLLLPVLSWLLLGSIEKRIRKQSPESLLTSRQVRRMLGLFISGLVFAISIAVSFTHEYHLFLDNVVYLFFFLSLIIPIYYGEFILGFILGMAYTFGAILPTIFILLLAVIGLLIYRFIRPLIIKLSRTFSNNPVKSANP